MKPSFSPKQLETICLLGLLALKLGLQMALIHPNFQLHRDEFLHMDLGRHLAWGYVSVQPLTGLLSALMLALGGGEWLVHLLPALLGCCTVWLAWKLCAEFTTLLPAKCATGLAVVLSPLLRINLLYQPNSLDLLWWTLGFLVIVRQLKHPRPLGFYALAAVAVAGLYSKYNFLFWLVGLGLALPLVRQRQWLLSPHLYAAAALALLALAPTLWWQWKHDFPFLRFVGELKQSQLEKLDRWQFLREQLLFAGASLPLVLIALHGLVLGRWRERFALLGWSVLLVLALFTWQQGKGYYAVGLYPFLFALGYAYVACYFPRPRWWIAGFTLVNVANAFVLLQIAFPYRSPEALAAQNGLAKSMGLHRWEDGKDHALPQDFADMLGWKEMAALVDKGLAGQKQPWLIKTDNYGQAGAVNFYSALTAGKAVTFNADYRYWMDVELQPATTILVMNRYDPAELQRLRTFVFGRVDSVGMVADTLAREYGTVVYRGVQPKLHVGRLLKQEMAEEKGL